MKFALCGAFVVAMQIAGFAQNEPSYGDQLIGMSIALEKMAYNPLDMQNAIAKMRMAASRSKALSESPQAHRATLSILQQYQLIAEARARAQRDYARIQRAPKPLLYTADIGEWRYEELSRSQQSLEGTARDCRVTVKSILTSWEKDPNALAFRLPDADPLLAALVELETVSREKYAAYELRERAEWIDGIVTRVLETGIVIDLLETYRVPVRERTRHHSYVRYELETRRSGRSVFLAGYSRASQVADGDHLRVFAAPDGIVKLYAGTTTVRLYRAVEN